MKEKFIDKVVKESLGDLKIKPNSNWQSFQNKLANNNVLQNTNIISNSSNFTNFGTKFVSFVTSKVTIISTVVLSTIGTTLLISKSETETNSKSKDLQNVSFIENKDNKRVVEISEEIETKTNEKEVANSNKLQDNKEVTNFENENNVAEFENENIKIIEEDIVDTVEVIAKKNIVIKKTIVVVDTVKTNDTTKIK